MPRSLYARRRARYGAPVDSVTRRACSVALGTALLLSGPRAVARTPASP